MIKIIHKIKKIFLNKVRLLQKNAYYRRSESVDNCHNMSIILFYRQTFDGQISVGNTNILKFINHSLLHQKLLKSIK